MSSEARKIHTAAWKDQSENSSVLAKACSSACEDSVELLLLGSHKVL